LLDLGVVIVTTSNRPPCGLYEGGINRSVFLPVIDTIRERMHVIEMIGGHDYRKDSLSSKSETKEQLLSTYVIINDQSASSSILQQWFSVGHGERRSETIPVAMGRSLYVQTANDSCGWFTFNELCKQPLGAADYIAIAKRFSVVIVEDVPQLGVNTYNEARRFVVLIDALYEAKTKLILSSNVERENLFVGFDATVATNDGDEEIAIDGSNLERESFIIGEGGSSSSSSTTLIRSVDNGTMEWSATGRIGVSLAQLSAVKEVSFSFKRAESRLSEMAGSNWGRFRESM
jgi:protein AFG1